MTITFSLYVWIPIILIPLGWVLLVRNLPADHFDGPVKHFFRVFSYWATAAFVIVTVVGFFTQHVTIK
ncbi:hypothetical protein D3C81_333760 [compost metagenome]